MEEEKEHNILPENPNDDGEVGKFRQWFREAADFMSDWREAAKQDYEFTAGKQWSDADIAALEESGRPAITINRIKPLINVLSGYQRLNRYDIDFLPRTNDDMDICTVRKGLTKYILDECEYDKNESQAFLDAVIGGLGWLEVGYKFDPEVNDGEAFVKREDPFGIYIDPETHKLDLSDAKYICRAKWVDKDDLAVAYPDHKDEIMAQYEIYDTIERTDGKTEDPLWYKRDTQKARLVECWYKTKDTETVYYLADGTVVPQKDMTLDYFLQGLVVGARKIPVTRVRVASFIERVLLEDIPSPYEHGELPFVPITCYLYGAGDLPAGFVRDLIDPQRELNKRRIQELHILNTTGNGGGFIEEGAMTPRQKAEFKKKATYPGYYAEVTPGALSSGKILERSMNSQAVPSGIVNAQQEAQNDLVAISGINEALMGVDIPQNASGRAIELKQKQAITHIAPMFDHLRDAKRKIAYLLWGRRAHKGIVPQFYTEDKVYRVEGQNGQQFIHVNQQVVQQDPMGRAVVTTLNDLSQGEFDIVVADVQSSTTQRQAQLWGLVDAVSNLGLPGDLVFDIIIDLSDLPNKEDIKQRWRAQQQQQAEQANAQTQAQQQMMQDYYNHETQLAQMKLVHQNQSIAFKDAPLPIQFAMAAKQGLIDPAIAQYATQLMVQQMFPALADQLKTRDAERAQQARQAVQQQAIQNLQQQAIRQRGMQAQAQQQAQPRTNGNNSGNAVTQPAIQSLMSGQGPAL